MQIFLCEKKRRFLKIGRQKLREPVIGKINLQPQNVSVETYRIFPVGTVKDGICSFNVMVHNRCL